MRKGDSAEVRGQRGQWAQRQGVPRKPRLWSAGAGGDESGWSSRSVSCRAKDSGPCPVAIDVESGQKYI